jgi:hypothetical protein
MTTATTTSTSSTGNGAPPPAGSGTSSILSDAGKKGEGEKGADVKTETKVETKGADVDKKTGDEKKGEGDTKAEKPAPIELKLPDRYEADSKQLDAYKALATELGLDSTKAQKAFDHFLSVDAARTEAAEKALEAQDAKWASEVKADPELGGDKLKATIADVAKAKAWLPPGLSSLLERLGLGNNPDVIRAFAKVGRAVKDDTIAGTGGSPGGTKPKAKSDAEIF